MKRRIAAAATSAALAVAGPAVAADRSGPRNGAPPRAGAPRVTRIAGAESDAAQRELNVLRRAEMVAHRKRLAAALAAELPGAALPAVERGLGAAGGQDLSQALARSTGASEDEINAAFEAMARHARTSRLWT